MLDHLPAALSGERPVPGVTDEPVVLSICGGLDSGLAAELRATLRAAVDERLVILDLSEVERIDLAGLGVVIGGIRGVHDHGGRAAIVACPGPVLDLLGKVGVARIAPVFTEFDEARANLGQGGR
ncbi:MAG: anti-sigma factor antagonist [Acidimicrobiaceae bacterium]|nr:anti-sigma factor antagonist [Acidimicrobiaceae bacterium]